MFRTALPRRGATIARPRRRVWAAVVAVTLGAVVLTGCAAGQISQTADQIANSDGAQGTVGQVGVSDALLATPDGKNYPKGAQAQLLLWVSNDAYKPDTLTAITTDAGTVTISGSATVPPLGIIEIGGSGAKITATISSLTRELDYGISVPMTFSFANAGDLSLNVPIKIPQERTEPRPTKNIYPEETPNLWNTDQVNPPAAG